MTDIEMDRFLFSLIIFVFGFLVGFVLNNKNSVSLQGINKDD